MFCMEELVDEAFVAKTKVTLTREKLRISILNVSQLGQTGRPISLSPETQCKTVLQPVLASTYCASLFLTVPSLLRTVLGATFSEKKNQARNT